MQLKVLLKPQYGIAFAPAIFAFSQIIILGYYWFFDGYFGDLTLTISRYVGLELWSSVLFAICNIIISVFMMRYYLATWKKLSTFWLICGIVQLIGFIGLSLVPHIAFVSGEAGETMVLWHNILARVMFFAMFGMAIERLRLATKDKITSKTRLMATNTCIFFLMYGLTYAVSYTLNLDVLFSGILIWETGYIYAFMGMLILTRK